MRKALILITLFAAGCGGNRIDGFSSNLTVEPSSIDFGTVAPRIVATRSIELSNPGRGDLHVQSVRITGAARMGAFTVVGSVATVSAGSKARLEVRFTGDSIAGADAASLLIESDADGQPRLSIAMVGRTAAAEIDAGQGDAGVFDGGMFDAGVADAGPGDAGPRDAGAPIPRLDGGYCNRPEVALALVTPAAQAAGNSKTVWTGSEIAVVWESKLTDGGLEVYFERVTALGQRVTGSERLISLEDGHYSASPRMAFSGTELGLVYLDDRNGSSMRTAIFRRLDLQGSPVGAELTVGPAFSGSGVTVAWQPASNEWGIAYSTLAGVRLLRVSATGTPTDVGVVAPGAIADVGEPLKPDGMGWALVTVNSGNALVRLRADGSMLSSQVIGGGIRPSVAPTGSSYAVVWGHDPTASFALADAQGQLVAGSAVQLSTSMTVGEPDVVWTGSDFVVTWVETVTTPQYRSTVWMRRLSAAGAPTTPALMLTCSANDMNFWPSLSAGPGFQLLSYSSGNGGQPYVAQLGLMFLY